VKDLQIFSAFGGDVLEVQKWYGHPLSPSVHRVRLRTIYDALYKSTHHYPLSPCRVWWGWDFACRRKVRFL